MSDAKSMRIRMYNVGFGDCFLITLPGPHCILVDCGFHANAAGKFDGDGLVAQIVEDVVEHMKAPRIDIVIATHRHRDHVFAFSSDKWDELEVGEAWFPWLDDPEDARARKLWRKHQNFAMHLAGALPKLAVSPEDKEQIEFYLWNAGIDARGAAAMGFRQWSNDHALEKLRARSRREPRYLPRTNKVPETFKPRVIPGLVAHVLGPPRDPDDIAHGDPPADQTFKRLALAALDENAPITAPPFPDAWRVNEGSSMITKAEEERVESLAKSADPLFAAQYVDRMINSTSLLIVLEFGRARLLLPGDAEWGTWRFLVGEGKHASKVRALLEGATFFKVGHHGSHNATPEDLVEKHLGKAVPAMISTQQGDNQFRNEIPLKKLVEALGERAVRSDKPKAKLPKGFKRGEGDKYIDLTVRI